MPDNQLRAKMAVLQLALEFAEFGTDPRNFLRQPLSARDGGVWTKTPQQPPVDATLQNEIKAILRGLTENREYEIELRIRFGIKRHASGIVVTRGSRTERDVFLYQLIRLLEDVGVERLRACPECGRLFLKVTRKQFCSTRCQAKVNM